MCIYIYVNVHTSYEWAWEQQHPNGDNAQILALIPFSTKNKQRSLEKWLISGLGQAKNMMSLEHLVPEIKEMLKKWWGHIQRTQKAG